MLYEYRRKLNLHVSKNNFVHFAVSYERIEICMVTIKFPNLTFRSTRFILHHSFIKPFRTGKEIFLRRATGMNVNE